MEPTPQVIMLPIESVQVGTRQRTLDAATSKHIAELADEIRSNGLLHAVAVNKRYELVSGWCRLNAIKSLKSPYFYASASIGVGFIPCAVVHQEAERDLFRLELMENLRRKALSPMDEAKAIAALHRMFAAEHGREWTETDTGVAVDTLRGDTRLPVVSRQEVADSLILDSFSNDPDVQKAKSRSEAMKIARKKMEQSMTEGLGILATAAHKDFSVIRGFCDEVMGKIPVGTLAGIIADPPYGIDADLFGDQAMVTGHQYADTEEASLEIAKSIFKLGYYACDDNAHLYMFCDIRRFLRLQSIAESYGWQVFQTPLIWHKVSMGHAPQPGYFSRRYEAILFARKGDRKLQKVRSDVFEYPAMHNKIHAAQKPVELYAELMKISFYPGEKVLDPCAGSGTIFRAAKLCNLQALGIELDEQYFNVCKQVIEELA